MTFIDLELLGLDFPAFALCKATMLACDPSGAGAGIALFAVGLPDISSPKGPAMDAAFMLLALADAAGLWRPAHPAPADLTLARGTPALSAETRRLRSRLDYT